MIPRIVTTARCDTNTRVTLADAKGLSSKAVEIIRTMVNEYSVKIGIIVLGIVSALAARIFWSEHGWVVLGVFGLVVVAGLSISVFGRLPRISMLDSLLLFAIVCLGIASVGLIYFDGYSTDPPRWLRTAFMLILGFSVLVNYLQRKKFVRSDANGGETST